MQYTVYDKETNDMYLLSDYERGIIKTRIQKGELSGDTGEFFYVTKDTQKEHKYLFNF